jgi:FkbM family methyltransferase
MNEYYTSIIEKSTIQPQTILEIGSRDGNDANLLASFFNISPEFIWVVEPNPKQFEEITKKYPNINSLNYAISNEVGSFDFNQVEGSLDDIGTSSLMDRVDNFYDNKSVKIKVDAITGNELLNIIGKRIDLCKIDVEGMTYQVLSSFGKSIDNIKSFHIECEHKEIWKNQKLYQDVSEFLISEKFTQVYFNYCSNDTVQSDSVWINERFIKS